MSAPRRPRRAGRALHRHRAWSLSALAPLVAVACAVDQPWDRSVDALLVELARGNHAALLSIDLVAYPPSHALALGQEAPLYLAKIMLAAGRTEDARRFLELQTRRGPSWARVRAGLLLAELRLHLGEHRLAAAAARRVVGSGAESDLVVAGEMLLTRALYRQREDEEVLWRVGDAVAGEELLLRAVARHRTATVGWDTDLLRLARAERSSELHERAWAYLTTGPARSTPPSELEAADLDALKRLMEAKSHLAGGNRRDAVTAFEDALGARPGLASTVIARELGAAYRTLGEAVRGAAAFQSLAEGQAATSASASAAVDAAIAEQVARLARDAGDHGIAVATLRQLQAAAATATARDRFTWLLLDIYLNRAPALRPAGEPPLVSTAAQWGDPSFFADLFAQQLARSVAARDWPAIASLRAALQARGDAPLMQARASYVLARAHQAGLLAGEPEAGSSARELLREVVTLGGDGYHGLLARLWLADAGTTAAAAASSPEQPDGAASPGAGEDVGSGSDSDRYAAGLFRFGLFAEGLATIATTTSPLSTWVLREAANTLAAAGRARESIGVASRLLARPAAERRTGDRELGYPRYYRDEVEQLDLGGVPEPVFYGLVREESRFDADIVSSAGAVGLTQLMPVTAADEARRMRLTDPIELTDVEQNLAIGAAHLARLYDRLEGSVARSLMAYNAGLSRVRGWDRAYQELPLDLYVEALPFAETRGYVRKILVSTLHYAATYWAMPERAAATLFYELPPAEPPAEPAANGGTP